jgi:hypothetical protein
VTQPRRREEDAAEPVAERAAAEPVPDPVVLALQRAAGNQAVTRYLQRTRTERRGRSHDERARTQQRQRERDEKPLRDNEPDEGESETESETEADETPSAYDQAYEQALNAFAQRTQKMDFSHSGQVPRFDNRYWTCTLIVHRKRKPRLERVPYTGDQAGYNQLFDAVEEIDFEYTLKSGVMPHVAIKAVFERGDKWAMDCIDYVVAARLYAECIAKGDIEFDRKYLDLGGYVNPQPMKMAQHDTPGLTGQGMWQRDRQGGEFRLEGEGTGQAPQSFADEDELLATLPVGTRVMWTSSFEEGDPDMENENTIKLGPDLYAAHPFGPSSAARIRRKLVVDEVTGDDGEDRTLTEEEQRQQAIDHIYVAEIERYDRD